MGLVLDSASAFATTAIGHVAHETSTGPFPIRPAVNPPRFGIDMAVIEPSEPSLSFVIYKLLENPGNFVRSTDCSSEHLVAAPSDVCFVPTDRERKRLEEWFVPLEPMPPVGSSLDGGLADLKLVQRFILAGATCQ
jgi:hypothetical protein